MHAILIICCCIPGTCVQSCRSKTCIWANHVHAAVACPVMQQCYLKDVKMHHLLGRQAGAEQPGKLWTHQTAAGRQIAVHHAWHLHLQCEHIIFSSNSQTMYGLSDCREAISIVLLAGNTMHRCDKCWHMFLLLQQAYPEQKTATSTRCHEQTR